MEGTMGRAVAASFKAMPCDPHADADKRQGYINTEQPLMNRDLSNMQQKYQPLHQHLLAPTRSDRNRKT
jgi:hypothetical protein